MGMLDGIFGPAKRKKSQKAALTKQMNRLKKKAVIVKMKKEIADAKRKLGEI